MTTFLIGLVILIVGGALYGAMCERMFGPDDRKTPALAKADGVDYVRMPAWKNTLIQLLNIAGTGPVLGPIQGILFGPIAFITIPLGCVLAGAVHDYFIGMISMRNGGAQMPNLVRKYLGGPTKAFYGILLAILLMLTGVVFVYTPGDLIVRDILGMDASAASAAIWIAYVVIFVYYLLATLFPIDAIIGRIYPLFGLILIISAVGVFGGILLDGGAGLQNISLTSGGLLTQNISGQAFIPVFFITVACGIMSGFHGSQTTLISRTVGSEHEGRATFYGAMIIEGFIAMCWAAGAMVLFSRGTPLDTNPTAMVGIISREFLGSVGGVLAIIGVIILPITSGDTCFRALRLIVAEQFNIDQINKMKRVMVAAVILIPAIIILFYAKSNPAGFGILWRYFGFTNQFVAVFALGVVSVYLLDRGLNHWVTTIPGILYTFIVMSFIAHANIGFGLEPRLGMEPNSYTLSYLVGLVSAIGFYMLVVHRGKKKQQAIANYELA